MFSKTITQLFSCLLILCGVSASAKITPPNEFYFTSDVYYVEKDATTATIEVAFVPGSRSYAGTVDYGVSTGNSVSSQNDAGLTHTLSFSGLAPSKTFTISIPLDSVRQGNETVLWLSNPNALITRSKAIVKFK